MLCYAVASYGSIVTIPAIPEWYASLSKPAFSPPNWLFAPVWTILYAMMALSIWLATEFEKPRGESKEKTPSKFTVQVVFLAQLLLNGLWSWAFFGKQEPILALVVLVAIFALVVLSIYLFSKRQPLAGWLLIPYGAWLLYAGALNTAIILLN
ncbi:tryptophan-rich sensory protein [Rhodobacteraceae bacterium RKSG542]|nr:TspO/MBR family protein [Pseudovibrio flavus]MTI18440.1 tryptophan-rich sensory protein [Pseudovibrio flavus]